MDDNAEVKSVRFVKSLIKSRAALTYQQAQDIVDGKPPMKKQRVVEDGEEKEIEVPCEIEVIL